MKQKTKNLTILLIVMMLSITIISACSPTEPTIDVDAQRTGFAQTAAAQATITAQAQPTATQTPEPTPTFTATPEYTNTPANTPTESEATTAPVTGGADEAQWLANDPPDNTEFIPGEEFTVTWTLENTGSSTWTTSYYIEFSSGEQMEAVDQVLLPYEVPPNTNVQVSVDFVAPESTGTKQGYWSIVNANDVPFYKFWVIVEVVEPGEVDEGD